MSKRRIVIAVLAVMIGVWGLASGAASQEAVEAAEPSEDHHAPGWYRRQVAGVMAARACQDAVARGGI